MNSTFIRLFWVIAALISSSAFADSFNFSYTFASDSTLLTGSFEGVQNGQYVENISNVTLAWEGSPIAATVFASTFDGGSGTWVAGPVVSFDSLNNNFAFADADLANGDTAYSSLFYMLHGSIWLGTYFESPATLAIDSPDARGTWTLTNLSVGSTVPDSGLTAGMLLLALAGLGLLRRKAAV